MKDKFRLGHQEVQRDWECRGNAHKNLVILGPVRKTTADMSS